MYLNGAGTCTAHIPVILRLILFVLRLISMSSAEAAGTTMRGNVVLTVVMAIIRVSGMTPMASAWSAAPTNVVETCMEINLTAFAFAEVRYPQ